MNRNTNLLTFSMAAVLAGSLLLGGCHKKVAAARPAQPAVAQEKPVAAPPSTPTVALQKPATVTPTPDFSVYDEKFLFLMTQEGWRCTGNSAVKQCKRAMVNFAHEICSYSGQPIDLVYENLSPPALLGPREERTAIAKAEQSYPNCALTSGP